MYKIAICDDDNMYINFIKSRILELNILKDDIGFYEFNSGEDFIDHLSIKPDLVILDIQMQPLDGNETAKILREINRSVIIVFCSGIYAPSIESCRVQPFAYLLKSLTDENMSMELKRILREVQLRNTAMFIVGKSNNYTYHIKANEVLYIEIAKRGCHIWPYQAVIDVDINEPLFSTERLRYFYDKLEHHGFVYAHNSYIVNLKHVRIIDSEKLTLVNGKVLNIARSCKAEFRKAFMQSLSITRY